MYLTDPVPSVKVFPRLVTVAPPNLKDPPDPVNCTVPPVASNVPFARNCPPLLKSNTPSISDVPVIVIMLFPKFNSLPPSIIKSPATLTSPWSVLAVPPPFILRL